MWSSSNGSDVLASVVNGLANIQIEATKIANDKVLPADKTEELIDKQSDKFIDTLKKYGIIKMVSATE